MLQDKHLIESFVWCISLIIINVYDCFVEIFSRDSFFMFHDVVIYEIYINMFMG